MQISQALFSRIIYLVAETRTKIPKPVMALLPGAEWVNDLHLGVGASTIPLERFEHLYLKGKNMGPGTVDELQLLLVRAVNENADVDTLSPKKVLLLYRSIYDLQGGAGMLLEPAELDLAAWQAAPDQETFNKWTSGFVPFDEVIQGFYQGLMVVMAKPGIGKTSLMLSLMESLIQREECSSVLFVENELPLLMMKYKMRPMLKRTKFRPNDKLVCASWGVNDLITYCQEHPDPNRVVFMDSPDVAVSGDPELRRFSLESAYQKLIALKQVSKLVVVSSQPNRKTADRPSMDGTAESWAKAWYADMILGIRSPSTAGVDGISMLEVHGLKNRFGASGRMSRFMYNYVELEADRTLDITEDF